LNIHLLNLDDDDLENSVERVISFAVWPNLQIGRHDRGGVEIARCGLARVNAGTEIVGSVIANPMVRKTRFADIVDAVD
jgi:hypothetical protein